MTRFSYKLVVAVRTDLELSRGKLAVQVAHAAVECALSAPRDVLGAWRREGAKKVVVKVPDLESLMALVEKAGKLGVRACVIRDAGLTEVPPGTVTCAGFGPDREERLDPITGSLPLLR